MGNQSKNRVYVAWVTQVATSSEAARREFEKASQHIIEEDCNPYASMLDHGFAASQSHVVCPDCGRASHVAQGHWCPTKQETVVVAGGIESSVKAIESALMGYKAKCLKSPAHAQERQELQRVWRLIKRIVKQGSRG